MNRYAKFLIGILCAGLLLAQATAAEPAPHRLGVALYGSNGGHQLRVGALLNHPNARLVAVCGIDQKTPSNVRRVADLDALLADPEVELVSLCSPRRADQARDAIRCLQAGKHVYAEKPSALSEADLDAVLAAASAAKKEFHEMAGTTFTQPYFEMRRLVRAGAIGEVIQVLVQKSYPYGAHRPQDEAIDGGLFLQVGIHAIRMIEHTAGVRIRTIAGWETALGNPEPGDGKMAGAVQMTLENGGLATVILNYLNPPHLKPRGHETLRIFGTKGFIESTDGGVRTRLVDQERVTEPLQPVEPTRDYFDFIAAHLATGAPLPLTSEEELHPLRMLLRAKAALHPLSMPAGAAVVFGPGQPSQR
jgi:predicted dehydrogenase